jgi:predicted nucleotidyltransferase
MTTTLNLERERYVKTLEGDLQNLIDQLKALPAVQKIVLFGSYAAGRRDLFTDLDVLVVMDSPLGFVDRLAALARQVHVRGPVDLLAYTPQEMERLRNRPFIRHALATGKVLYERRTEA